MSQETLQPDAVQNTGLTPEQNQEAIDLRANVANADERLQDTLWQQEYNKRAEARDRAMGRSPRDPASVFGLTAVLGAAIDAGERAWDKHGVKKAERTAVKHYGKHKAAYEEQAEKEAIEAGVEINR